MTKSGLQIQTFNYAESKPLVDEMDRTLAECFGLSHEELDYLINYDIKYRMALEGED